MVVKVVNPDEISRLVRNYGLSQAQETQLNTLVDLFLNGTSQKFEVAVDNSQDRQVDAALAEFTSNHTNRLN